MAETRSEEGELVFPAKRKPDLASSNADEDLPSKILKTEDKINGNSHLDGGDKTTVHSKDSGTEKDEVADATGISGADLGGDKEEDEVQDCESDEDDEEDDEDYGEDDYDDIEEGARREVDVKGKGILKDNKGKGKLILDDEDSDVDETDDKDSSDSDGDVRSGSDSDWSDDPLAEVDLDNILPSRTRRRRSQSGIFISSNKRNTDGNNGGTDA
ncbi:hypothetical protein SAY87_007255 [Trapa incisa]|uniref:Uncharacterized protein n=1 Tax=Trapa incisa TaxID=236973 RepID=A0AAN7Q0L2_9MYRT|nr:hypothetical protein SAY87_007255 [Trapa incisa]